MDNVIVDGGYVGVSSLIKAAMPELHSGSILRSARSAMKNFDGPGLTPKMVKGRMTTMASLDTCKYILDNLSGPRWLVWRTTQGKSFKESLTQHVALNQSLATPVQGVVEEVAEAAEVETKESTLKKAFRTLDIDGSVRIDEASGKASIIDVIRLLCPDASPQYAAQMLIRLLERENADELREVCNSAHNSDSIAARVHYTQINGKGRSTPVSDVKTIVEIMFLLPTSAAKAFRRQSAEVITRVLGGDVSLCGEIEERCARLESTSEGRSYQNFMVGGNRIEDQKPAKRTRIGPEIMQLASEDQYAKYVQVGLQQEMVNSEVSLVMSLKEAFEQITPLEDRQKIELCDRLSDIQGRAFRSTEEVAVPRAITSSSPVGNAVVVATQVQQDPGHGIPTPNCSRDVRGEEVSIAMIATEMGVSVRGRGGLVGKKLKALYAERYGANAANHIPKRSVIYAGRPYMENSYYSRDRDLVERAVRMVFSV